MQEQNLNEWFVESLNDEGEPKIYSRDGFVCLSQAVESKV